MKELDAIAPLSAMIAAAPVGATSEEWSDMQKAGSPEGSRAELDWP